MQNRELHKQSYKKSHAADMISRSSDKNDTENKKRYATKRLYLTCNF